MSNEQKFTRLYFRAVNNSTGQELPEFSCKLYGVELNDTSWRFLRDMFPLIFDQMEGIRKAREENDAKRIRTESSVTMMADLEVTPGNTNVA